MTAIGKLGRTIFALAIIGFGVETLICAHYPADNLGFNYSVVPILPWLPGGIPWLAYLFGAIWIACGVGLLSKRTARVAALVLGSLLTLCTLVLIVPKATAHFGSMSLRTIVFEPLSIACLAWLMPGPDAMPSWLTRVSRYLLAIGLIIFGIDHFLALAGIGSLLPGWIPWHVFWVAFFGVAFIAGGLSIALDILQRWGAFGIGLMFGIWVVTLHLPRVLGLYGIPGAPRDPDEWSSLLIAIALWGGSWALAGVEANRPTSPLDAPSN
jgi:uncharacterized membrane protein